MSRAYLLGLDLGGSGIRALLLEPERGAITTATRSWKSSVAPGTGGLGADLDLADVFRNAAEVSREVRDRAGASADQIRGVAASALRFGTVVLSCAGEPLLAVPNRDARAAAEAADLAERFGAELYTAMGLWPVPLVTAARLLWLEAHRPQTLRDAGAVLSLGDWLTWRLCGERVTDPTQAGCSLLFDLVSRSWSAPWIDRLGIRRALFPAVAQSGLRVGELGSEVAHALGLRAGTPVAVAGADTQCGILGAGVTAVGTRGAIAGTSLALQLVVDRPVLDPEKRLWTGHHVVPDRYVLESNAGTQGEALSWLARAFYPDAPAPEARLLAESATSEPGAAGVFSTLGADVFDARQLGLPVGDLSLNHLTSAGDPLPRRHLVRAAVEGFAFGVRANLELLAEVGGPVATALRVAGGQSRSESWTALLCDVLGARVEVAACAHASALGSALCAGVAVGVFSDLEAAAGEIPRVARVHEPDPERAAAYDELYERWRALREEQAPARRAAAGFATSRVLRTATENSVRPTLLVRPRILVTADLDRESLRALRSLGEVDYASFRDAMRLLAGPSLIEALTGVQVFITEVDIVDTESLAKLPDLRVVVACRGDAVNVDVDACSAYGVPVLFAPGRNADSVADLTLALMLMLARKIPEAAAFLRGSDVSAGDLGKMGAAFTTLRGRELWRSTVGLVGLGAVGRAVARRLGAFGARVLVADPFVDAESAALCDAEKVPLSSLLERSDFVSLHAAVTDETRGLLGRRELARMKPDAFLINTARAALVDEEALIEALQGGRLAGAALDTFAVEPPGPEHPLLQLENVIATPHVGGNTLEVSAHQGAIVVEGLRQLLHGEAPSAVLNPESLCRFDWTASRPEPDAALRASLAKRPAPTVSDLQREAPSSEATLPTSDAPPELRAGMERLLRVFTGGISADEALRGFSEGRDVLLHFSLPDVALEFQIHLLEGTVSAGLAPPSREADVRLRMRAAVLDGMFRGRIDPMQSAMNGEICFVGDAAKGLTLQHVQSDLQRLYAAARSEAGEPAYLDSAFDRAPTVATPANDGELRAAIVRVVSELYATQLITATGGNVSARVPGCEEILITPSRLFKGDLGPEVLVRIDFAGRALDPDARSPSSEWSMHCALYRQRPDIAAVVHAHAPHATTLANAGLRFLPISTEAAFFGNIARVPFIMPGTAALAEAVAEAMDTDWAALMVNHGLVVAGRSLRRAADTVEIIDRSAQTILGCHAAGREPSVLPDDVVAELRKMGDLVA